MKYVECNYCGKRINFGEEVVSHRLFCGIYCSDKCFILAKVPDRKVSVLTVEVANENIAEIKEG